MPFRPYSAKDKDVEFVAVQMSREIRTLLAERSAINRRIDTIKKALVGLAPLVGDEILKETLDNAAPQPRRGKNGITRACRMVLMNSENPLSAREVHERVCREDPMLLADYRIPMTPIYAVLGRLVKRGEVCLAYGEKGRRTWGWIQAASGPARQESTEAAYLGPQRPECTAGYSRPESASITTISTTSPNPPRG